MMCKILFFRLIHQRNTWCWHTVAFSHSHVHTTQKHCVSPSALAQDTHTKSVIILSYLKHYITSLSVDVEAAEWRFLRIVSLHKVIIIRQSLERLFHFNQPICGLWCEVVLRSVCTLFLLVLSVTGPGTLYSTAADCCCYWQEKNKLRVKELEV